MRVLNRITRFLSWLPLIWNDQDWDWFYFMRLLNRKLSNMEKFFGSDRTHLADSDQTRKRIRYARILTDRILADEYDAELYEKHYEKWGHPVFSTEPTDHGASSRLIIEHPEVKTEEDSKQENKEFRRMIQHGEHMKQQDIDQLFGTMAKYMQGWWD